MSKLLNPPIITGIKSALFIQPHPDDNEIGAGGTMARLISDGCRVYGLTVTDGRLGGENVALSPDGVADLRKKEALAAMASLGVINAGFLGFEDQTHSDYEEIAASIREIIDFIKPEAVFTVDPFLRNEWHRDHLKVGQAVNLAVQLACHKVPILGYYYTDRPNTYFNITEFYPLKMRAIGCHESQLTQEFLAFLEDYFAQISKDTPFAQTEKLNILSSVHTHCWTLKLDILSY